MSLLDEKQRNAVLRTLHELRRAAPAKPGEQYGAPGNGSSMGLSLGTICVVFALWFFATNGGWIKPLFCPRPRRYGRRSWMSAATDVPKPACGHISAGVPCGCLARLRWRC